MFYGILPNKNTLSKDDFTHKISIAFFKNKHSQCL